MEDRANPERNGSGQKNTEAAAQGYPENLKEKRMPPPEPATACVYAGPGMMYQNPQNMEQFMMAYAGPATNPDPSQMAIFMAAYAGPAVTDPNAMAPAPSNTNASPQTPVPEELAPGEWICECGAVNTGRFCQECGRPRPSEVSGSSNGAQG